MLKEYTVHILNETTVEIDLAEPLENENQIQNFVGFFKKYKKKVSLGLEGKYVRSIICPYNVWVEYLLHLGFKDNAKALGEILNEQDAFKTDDFFNNLLQAKPAVEDFRQPRSKNRLSKRRRVHLENMDIKRRLEVEEESGKA